MTPATLRAARKSLGLTQSQFAATLGYGARIVLYWESGEREVPELVSRIVQAALEHPEILGWLVPDLAA